MPKCDYLNCNQDAVTTGTVFDRNLGGADLPTTVHACDVHRKLDSFFDDQPVQEQEGK